jgi:predicted alpha/beta-hydrolase family hydrolase
MKSKSLSLNVSKEIGKVSAETITPEKSKCIMTLAHGAGAGMNHAFMVALSNALAELNIATLRFNFPFTENKSGRPDRPDVAHKTIEAAITKAVELFSGLPLFVSGKSFGGRMSSQYLSSHPDKKVKGIIFYGFPLHPAGKPSTERSTHLKDLKIPQLFLQGSRDALATLDLIEKVCASLPLSKLEVIEGADHSFKAGKTDTIKILADNTSAWMDKLIKK